jgi:hypothetical protein
VVKAHNLRCENTQWATGNGCTGTATRYSTANGCIQVQVECQSVIGPRTEPYSRSDDTFCNASKGYYSTTGMEGSPGNTRLWACGDKWRESTDSTHSALCNYGHVELESSLSLYRWYRTSAFFLRAPTSVGYLPTGRLRCTTLLSGNMCRQWPPMIEDVDFVGIDTSYLCMTAEGAVSLTSKMTIASRFAQKPTGMVLVCTTTLESFVARRPYFVRIILR